MMLCIYVKIKLQHQYNIQNLKMLHCKSGLVMRVESNFAFKAPRSDAYKGPYCLCVNGIQSYVAVDIVLRLDLPSRKR